MYPSPFNLFLGSFLNIRFSHQHSSKLTATDYWCDGFHSNLLPQSLPINSTGFFQNQNGCTKTAIPGLVSP